MKKGFAFILSVIVIGLFSCNSGAGGEAYTIKMRLKQGDSFDHNTKMNMDMNMGIAGQPINMKMGMNAAVKFDVMEPAGENNVLKLTYNSMNMTMDMGHKMPGQVNMDSIMNKNTQRMIGKSVTIDLSPKNEIVAVTGFDSIMLNEDTDAAGKKMMEQMFSKEQMNSLFGAMFSMYPNKPVKAGESWTAKTKVNMANIDMLINLKYTLVGVKNGVADIDLDGLIDGTGKMNQGGVSIDVTMKGSQKGMLTIKLDDGYLQNGAYKMDIKADMEMMGQKIPMTIKADYTLSGK